MEDEIVCFMSRSPQSPLSTTNSCNDDSNANDKHSHDAEHHKMIAMLTSGDTDVDVDRDGDRASNTPIVNSDGMLQVHKGKPVRVQVKVLVPIHDHPNFNFVGKLLGPKGNSLKWLQDQTQTKMAILGRGSMRDKMKEEELRRKGDVKDSHLNEDLHVEITAFAPPPEAYSRIGHALHEIKRFLVPDYYDEIRQQQLRELGILNADGKQIENDVTYSGSGSGVSNGRMSHALIDPTIHHTHISSFGKASSPSSHLAISHAHSQPHAHLKEAYSDNHCPSLFCMNRENDWQLSQYQEQDYNWHKKSSNLKISPASSSLTKGNPIPGTFYRAKPYSRTHNIYH